MDGLTLLRRAHDVGLRLEAAGDKLVIRGPKRAEPVVKLLAEHKAEVLQALALLWQIYSRCFSAPIQDRQYGHRCGLDCIMRSTMAWRTAGNVG